MAQIPQPVPHVDLRPQRSVVGERPKNKRLGALLEEAGVPAETVTQALESQISGQARLGEVLLASGAISSADLTTALARQSGIGEIDLHLSPVDVGIASTADAAACLRLSYVPWRSFGRVTVLAISDPSRISEIEKSYDCKTELLAYVLAPDQDISDSIARVFRNDFRKAALNRCPENLSCRNWGRTMRHPRLLDFGFCLAVLTVLRPSLVFMAIFIWVVLANAATTLMRLSALLHHRRARRRDQAPLPPSIVSLPGAGKTPVISVLIPLLREDKILPGLIAGMGRSDYPKARLDIKLLLEEDDDVTRNALAKLTLPPWITPLVVPEDTLKTKPRAMNYALPFCRGDIVGIYDAEDRPETDQLRIVADALTTAPPDVACVQGYLDFYNPRQNWLARCFTIEYAMWFRVLLAGVERLGVPIPLGGTTVFFRRRLLEEIGGWDAHNVTEDADLGMRLARFGYRCQMVATTTMEEANCHPYAWIKQRSRWLKGYAMTWLTHMRRPAALARDLGWRGFIGFQVLFLGAMTAYLAAPMLWVLWLGVFGVDFGIWSALPLALWWIFLGSMLLGQLTQLAVALTAVWPEPRRHLLAVVPTLILYWPLGAIAAYRALLEVFTMPFYWHKTKHGL